jgi:hypothetical protein
MQLDWPGPELGSKATAGPAKAIIAATINATVPNKMVRLISASFFGEGGTRQPSPVSQHYNGSDSRQLGVSPKWTIFAVAWSCLREANFREPNQREVRRTPLLRGRVNKQKKPVFE